MMSILLRPKFEPQYAPMLTLVMGMAVAKAVKKFGFDVSIKWPNDVVASHQKNMRNPYRNGSPRWKN